MGWNGFGWGEVQSTFAVLIMNGCDDDGDNDDGEVYRNYDNDVECNDDLIVGAGEGERGRSRLGSAEGSEPELRTTNQNKYLHDNGH